MDDDAARPSPPTAARRAVPRRAGAPAAAACGGAAVGDRASRSSLRSWSRVAAAHAFGSADDRYRTATVATRTVDSL